MHATQLEIFKQTKGIGSASGIYSNTEKLYIIGDNSAFLNQYDLNNNELEKIQVLFDQTLTQKENIPKSLKPDFEVLCHFENKFYILGSGSTPHRNGLIVYDLNTKKIKAQNVDKTYEKMRQVAEIDLNNFNIEGAIFTGKQWLLFNRGNGQEGKNGIFTLMGNDLTIVSNIKFSLVQLPHIKHVESSFTDAIQVGKDIFFIATAEDTRSTYHDGEILGSFIGSIDAKSLKLNFSYKIPGKHKFEGITSFKQAKNKMEFLLCEDRDTEQLDTTIYKLSLTF